MKKLIFFSLLGITLFFTACTKQASVESMLKDPATRDQIFSGIIGDHETMAAFMGKMTSDEHIQMMMKDNQEMMGMMMSPDKMMQMMKDKPEMMHQMMSDMMKDGNMMGHMMQMMNGEGMMSDECLQSGMQMMKDKGMPMGMMGSH